MNHVITGITTHPYPLLLTKAKIPRTVDVCETEVNLNNLFESEGLLTDSLQSKYTKNKQEIQKKLSQKYKTMDTG